MLTHALTHSHTHVLTHSLTHHWFTRFWWSCISWFACHRVSRACVIGTIPSKLLGIADCQTTWCNLGIISRMWLPRPRWLLWLLGFYKSPNIMALRMPDQKLLLWEHVNCLVNCCKLTPMGCLILVILLRYVLCIWILSCFLVIPNVLTILHFMICLPQSFPHVRHWNSSLEASRHSRLSDHMMYFRDYVP